MDLTELSCLTSLSLERTVCFPFPERIVCFNVSYRLGLSHFLAYWFLGVSSASMSLDLNLTDFGNG